MVRRATSPTPTIINPTPYSPAPPESGWTVWQILQLHDESILQIGMKAGHAMPVHVCIRWMCSSWFPKRDDAPTKRGASRRPAFPSGLRSTLPSAPRPVSPRSKTLHDVVACMKAKSVRSRGSAIDIVAGEHPPTFEQFPADEARPVSTCRTVRVRLPPREYNPLATNHSTSFERCLHVSTSLESYLLGLAH